MPLGPSQNYLAKYNTYQLPGYVQEEAFDSEMNIASHYGAYVDGSQSEYVGLQNKQLTLTLKVWEPTFAASKEAVQQAATYLRSHRNGFAPLYVQYSDRHYDALVKTITLQNEAGKSVRTMTYDLTFECRPWLIDDATQTLTGTGTISTDQVSRTIAEGGWTPTLITVTGSNVTISGYTDTGDFAGFISVAGSVSNLVIDSEAYTAEISGVNSNDLMNNADYQMMVGPGKTNFAITGASSCTIEYSNRWYI